MTWKLEIKNLTGPYEGAILLAICHLFSPHNSEVIANDFIAPEIVDKLALKVILHFQIICKMTSKWKYL